TTLFRSVVCIGDIGPQQQGAAAYVDRRADCPNDTFANLPWKRVKTQQQLQAGLHQRQIMFGDAKIDLQGVDGFDGYEGIARAHIIANRHIAQPDQTIEGSNDSGLLKLRLCQGNGSALHLQLTGRLVPCLLADKALASQLARSSIMADSQRQVCFGLLQLSFGDAVIQRSEEHTSELQSRANLVCRP